MNMEKYCDNNELAKYMERLHTALQASKTCVYEVDIINQTYTFFENSEAIFGVSGDVILRDVQPFSKLNPEDYRIAVSNYFSHPDDEEVISEAFRSIFNGIPTSYQARMRAGGSNFIWCQLYVTPVIENNVPVRMIGVISDISEQKLKNDHLEAAAKLDTFTNLYNKNSSINAIQYILNNFPHQKHALILIDIDNFKYFNDTYGHSEGDKALKTFADILKKQFRETDILGRFGGDEFLLFIYDISDTEWLTEILQQLTGFSVEHAQCTNSLGVSLFPQDGTDFDTLFKKADDALYHSKLIRNSYTFFSEELCSKPHSDQ